MKKFITAVILTLLFSSSLSYCKKTPALKIALMTKFESGSIIGSSEAGAVNLYLEEKGIKNIEIIYADDAWDPKKAVTAYEELKGKGIDILITSHISTCAVAIADMINRDRILTFVTGAVTDELSGIDDYILRNIQDVDKEQKSISEYIKNNFPKPLLIIRDNNNYAYTDPALKYFLKYFGRENVSVVDVSMSSIDYLKLEKDIKKTRFSSVYLLIGGYKIGAGSIAQMVRKMNPFSSIIYTPWMNTPSLLETAGSSITGSVMPSHYPSKKTDASLNAYLNRFRDKYGYAPTFISLNVYTAFELIDRAIKSGASDPDSIKNYLLKSGEIKTEFASTLFNQWGDVDAPLYFITDIPGEF